MKAIRIHQFGGSGVLQYEDSQMPVPGEGEVRVKLQAIGVNFIDVYHRIGRYPRQLPITPGEEGAGLVDAVGPGVTDLHPGDKVVYALQTGSYAEYVNVPARKLVSIPDGLD